MPHPDVLANRFREAEFAADLFAVDSGNASEDYASPANFFRITYLTEGLRRVLTIALQRLSGVGGDPVIGLQTAFGGGKTHTMLAVYHLAAARDVATLDGVSDLAGKAGVTKWTTPKVAAFVGSAAGPDIPLKLKGGPTVHTLWGYLAWRLASDKSLKLVAEAEAARTNPGSERMLEVLKLAGPSLIVLDELVAYARQLTDERFEALLSFVQSLTEAAKMAPRTLVLGSLPESIAEAGGPKGQEALLRLEKVFGRVQSAWLPAAGDETYEIIRRRLFQALDSEGERARDEAVKQFHDLYRKNPAEFPPEAREARYQHLLRLSYPIHPELFDRLSKDWASLANFQRTRGVLRFMANVVGVLWHNRTRDPLITPARIPLAHERIRASVLYPLNPGFAAVIDREVDGDGSLPARMELNPSRRITQARAATRAARAVFMCSAPLAGQPNAGLTGQGLHLACAEPGDQLAIFGEALRELSERATYLYEEAGRYWFSTQPTLNRLAEDRGKALPDHEVDAAIAEILREDGGAKGGFHRVHAAPDDVTGIDEAPALSLVILGTSTPHVGRGVAKSAATEAITEALTRCRASQRRLRNTLLFVAPDEAQLSNARDAMRRALAWESIVDDKRLKEQLTTGQIADAEDKARTGRDGARKAVRAAWSHVLNPVKVENTGGGLAFELEHLSVSVRDRATIPSGVYDKAKGDGVIKEKLGPDSFWSQLKPLWAADKPHLAISEIAEWFAAFPYMPKLRDRVVVDTAIGEAMAKLDPPFAFAERFDDGAGKYVGLRRAGFTLGQMPPSALLVRAEVADAQVAADNAATPVAPTPEVAHKPTNGGGATSAPPAKPVAPRRFYGSVEIDISRPVKTFDAILNAVVLELQRTPGAKVKLTLEVEAEAADGFGENDVGVVRDNARHLKFKAESTGFE
ncbi:MAG: ATP-binding protein [Reyranellaceae bacterium]